MLKYLKTKNDVLFKSLENLDEDYGNMEKNQNYIPLYKKIFIMGDNDHEDTVLVSKEILNEIKKVNEETNNFNCDLLDVSTNEIINKDIFIKFANSYENARVASYKSKLITEIMTIIFVFLAIVQK